VFDGLRKVNIVILELAGSDLPPDSDRHHGYGFSSQVHHSTKYVKVKFV